MAAKLLLALLALAIIISVAVIVTFWYFKETAELNHEKEMKQMEQTEQLFESEFNDDSIDRELEKEEKRTQE